MSWLFKELIAIALGSKVGLTRHPSDSEWEEVYHEAEKQALIGILFSAVEKLNKEDKTMMPPKPLFFQWLSMAMQIETQNKKMDYAADQLTRIFKAGGLRSCVLKGQGIARLYPQPERRQSGDIDLWVEGGRNRILFFLKDSFFGKGQVVIHHVDTCIIDGVESEIHFIPVYACNPFLHHKLYKFFKKNADAQFSNFDEILGFSYPTLSFNAVYILAHIYMHFLYEGIGLRQIVDYYFVLTHLSEKEKEQAHKDIKSVGLFKFSGAVMYVLKAICGLNLEQMITEPDEKRGTLLLNEIIKSGNFGKYDDSLGDRDENEIISFNLIALKRQLRFVQYYPMDVFFIPIFKVFHWFWRKRKGYL